MSPSAAALPSLQPGGAHGHCTGQTCAGKCSLCDLEFKLKLIDHSYLISAASSSQASAEGLLDASAVQFCARKVSAVSGDARKALDICR